MKSSSRLQQQQQQQQQPPQNWKEALDRYCHQHACLQATLSQIVMVGKDSSTCEDDDNVDDFEVPWTLPTPMEIVTPKDYTKFKNVGTLMMIGNDHHLNKNKSTMESKSSYLSSLSSVVISTPVKMFHVASSLVGGIYGTVKYYTTDSDEYWHDEPDLLSECNHQQQHDNVQDSSTLMKSSTKSTTTMVSLDQSIVHVELTKECLSTILESAISMITTSTTISTGTETQSLILRRPPWILVARSDWVQWVRSVTTNIFSPSRRLSLNDIHWLLEILVTNHHVHILTRTDIHKSDIIIFSTATATACTTKPLDVKDPTLQVPLALFDLQHSMKQTEIRLENIANQIQICTTNALRYKKQSQNKMALAQMARRKLLQDQMDSQTSILIQLEQVYHSIETAESNQIIFNLLSESTNLLHQLSSQTSLTDIDDMKDDMADLLEDIEMKQTAMTIPTSNTMEGWSEEELLTELLSLTITDDDETGNVNETTTKKTKKNDSGVMMIPQISSEQDNTISDPSTTGTSTTSSTSSSSIDDDKTTKTKTVATKIAS